MSHWTQGTEKGIHLRISIPPLQSMKGQFLNFGIQLTIGCHLHNIGKTIGISLSRSSYKQTSLNERRKFTIMNFQQLLAYNRIIHH